MPADQRRDVDQQQRTLLGVDQPERDPFPPLAHRSADRSRIASRLDDVFDAVDDQCVMMTVELDDGGFADAVAAIGIAKVERAAACRSPSAPGYAAPTGRRHAARRGAPGIRVSSSTTDFDGGGGEGDAVARNRNDEQQLGHFAPPAAGAFQRHQQPSAIVTIDAIVPLIGVGLVAQHDDLAFEQCRFDRPSR